MKKSVCLSQDSNLGSLIYLYGLIQPIRGRNRVNNSSGNLKNSAEFFPLSAKVLCNRLRELTLGLSSMSYSYFGNRVCNRNRIAPLLDVLWGQAIKLILLQNFMNIDRMMLFLFFLSPPLCAGPQK